MNGVDQLLGGLGLDRTSASYLYAPLAVGALGYFATKSWKWAAAMATAALVLQPGVSLTASSLLNIEAPPRSPASA